MDMVLSNGFGEMTQEEMMLVDGGGFGYVFGGCLLISASPFIAALNVGAGVGVFGLGLAAIGKGCH